MARDIAIEYGLPRWLTAPTSTYADRSRPIDEVDVFSWSKEGCNSREWRCLSEFVKCKIQYIENTCIVIGAQHAESQEYTKINGNDLLSNFVLASS
jgi:hypothetical protein